MSVQVKYSEAIFSKIKDVQTGSLSVSIHYRKGYNYVALIAINLIFVVRADGLVTSLIYEDDDGEVVQRPLAHRFTMFNTNATQPEELYKTLFDELEKCGVIIEPQENDGEVGYNISCEEVFGPAYFNLEGYTVCWFNDEYSYNSLKPLGTFFGHMLTDQPFSYQKFLSTLFTEDEE